MLNRTAFYKKFCLFSHYMMSIQGSVIIFTCTFSCFHKLPFPPGHTVLWVKYIQQKFLFPTKTLRKNHFVLYCTFKILISLPQQSNPCECLCHNNHIMLLVILLYFQKVIKPQNLEDNKLPAEFKSAWVNY